MRDKGRKGIAKVLYGHVRECINFDCGGKGGHNGRTEAVDKPLYHENAEIHDGLLDAGQERKIGDFSDAASCDMKTAFEHTKFRAVQQCVNGNSDAGNILGNDGCSGGSGYAPRKFKHKEQIQRNV